MDEDKLELIGSKKCDLFKFMHKEKLRGDFYATDADLCLVSKFPPGTVAYIDYKASEKDFVQFSEGIQYNEWLSHAPVYIIWAEEPETGPFTIRRYLGSNWRPDPPEVNWGDIEPIHLEDWAAFKDWERDLRKEFRSRGGWRGNLRME
jgi:hypothetical protein